MKEYKYFFKILSPLYMILKFYLTSSIWDLSQILYIILEQYLVVSTDKNLMLFSSKELSFLLYLLVMPKFNMWESHRLLVQHTAGDFVCQVGPRSLHVQLPDEKILR